MSRLTLGPVLFNWAPETWRDFYARMADEAPVDRVVIGEVVCSKRLPFFADLIPDAVERLTAAGKEVVLASPVLVAMERDRRAVEELVSDAELPVEANDMGALALLAGRPHDVGPFVNTYNEGTLAWLARRGARRVSLPAELPRDSVAAVAAAAVSLGVAVEVQVFGRTPLAISARCYHARAHGLHKDACQFVCNRDPDGMAVDTLEGQPFLAVNGTQTLSNGCLALVRELADLRALGVEDFRLSPQTTDMVAVARIFRDLLDGTAEAGGATEALARMVAPIPLENGFYHRREGARMVG